MREDTLILVRRLISFYLAVEENLSQHINVVLPGIYSKNRWQETQRQEQASTLELMNGTFHDQPANRNSHQQTNRLP